MRSNARASCPSSSGAASDDRLVEAAVRDPLRRHLEPPDPAGEERREQVAENDRECGRDRRGDDHAATDDLDRLEIVVERRRDEQHGARAATTAASA